MKDKICTLLKKRSYVREHWPKKAKTGLQSKNFDAGESRTRGDPDMANHTRTHTWLSYESSRLEVVRVKLRIV